MSDRYHLVCGDVLRPRPTVTRGLFWGKVHADVCVCVNEPLGLFLRSPGDAAEGPLSCTRPSFCSRAQLQHCGGLRSCWCPGRGHRRQRKGGLGLNLGVSHLAYKPGGPGRRAEGFIIDHLLPFSIHDETPWCGEPRHSTRVGVCADTQEPHRRWKDK